MNILRPLKIKGATFSRPPRCIAETGLRQIFAAAFLSANSLKAGVSKHGPYFAYIGCSLKKGGTATGQAGRPPLNRPPARRKKRAVRPAAETTLR
jgi:hypothetical protein